MTTDEALAKGVYTDRRGRQWTYLVFSHRWVRNEMDYQGVRYPVEKLEDEAMRKLVERDLHREVCPGLRSCPNHPVAHLVWYRYVEEWRLWPWGDLDETDVVASFDKWEDAMNKAIEWERYGYE